MRAPRTFSITEVVGNWDDGTARKITANAIAVHGQFAEVIVHGGTTVALPAMMDAGHQIIYGSVIIVMLFVYGRIDRVTS